MSDQPREISDLIGVEITVAVGVWFLIVLAAFFFIGPIAGLVTLVIGIVGFGWAAISAIRRADTSD